MNMISHYITLHYITSILIPYLSSPHAPLSSILALEKKNQTKFVISHGKGKEYLPLLLLLKPSY